MFSHLNTTKYGRRPLKIHVEQQDFSHELLEKFKPDILIIRQFKFHRHSLISTVIPPEELINTVVNLWKPFKSTRIIIQNLEFSAHSASFTTALVQKSMQIIRTFFFSYVFIFPVFSLLSLGFQTLNSIWQVTAACFRKLNFYSDCPTDLPYTTLSEPNSEFSRSVWNKFPNSQFTSLSTYSHSHCPSKGWSEAGLLPGANFEATHGENCAVISYRKGNLKSLYISTLIEYGVAQKNNAQWLYWALMYLARK